MTSSSRWRARDLLPSSETAISLAALALVTWVARYWNSAGFGLYEDDYFRVIPAAEFTWSNLFSSLRGVAGNLQHAQGRPLHDLFIHLGAFLGYKLAGLPGIYLLGYLVVLLNAFLCYFLLKRIYPQSVFVLTGSMAYALFPADTTQAFLTSSFGIQPALTLLLISMYLYLGGWRKLSYLAIAGTLFCYETVFPVFLAAPLIADDDRPMRLARLIRHALILGLLLVAVTVLRGATGESRVSELTLYNAFELVPWQMLAGPLVSMKLLLTRPIEGLARQGGLHPVLLAAAFAGLLALLVRFSGGPLPRTAQALRFLGQLALAGVVMLVLAYPFTFTVPATEIVGRATRVHLAAVVGISLLFACLSSLAFFAAQGRWRYAVATVPALFFTGAIGAGLAVQQDYVDAWRYQRAFWTDALELCPDLRDGVLIFVDPTGLRETRQIFTYGWNTHFEFRYLFHFPPSWDQPPLVFWLREDWREMAERREPIRNWVNHKGWVALPDKIDESRPTEWIWLEVRQGRLRRRSEPPRPALPRGEFPRTPLYDLLIKPTGEAPTEYSEEFVAEPRP